MSALLSSSEVIQLLRERSYGKQDALAFEAGVSPAHVSRVLNGHSLPGPRLLRLIGLRKVPGFEVAR